MVYWNHHFVVCAPFHEISWIINETLQLSRSYNFYEQNPLEIFVKNTIFVKNKGNQDDRNNQRYCLTECYNNYFL